MTSITDSNGRCETQGVATIEAQSVGLPAIVFDSGGIKYTVDNNRSGFIIKEKDSAGMAIAVMELVQNKEIYSRMSLNAIIFVKEKFSNASQREILTSIYEGN